MIYDLFMKLTQFRGIPFRKSFHRIGGLRALTRAPVMTLTASALPATEHNIASSLALKDPVFVRRPLNRTNIFYTVKVKSAVMVNISLQLLHNPLS